MNPILIGFLYGWLSCGLNQCYQLIQMLIMFVTFLFVFNFCYYYLFSTLLIKSMILLVEGSTYAVLSFNCLDAPVVTSFIILLSIDSFIGFLFFNSLAIVL